jgi:hypothetical protein
MMASYVYPWKLLLNQFKNFHQIKYKSHDGIICVSPVKFLYQFKAFH